jgi:hypothetical protein
MAGGQRFDGRHIETRVEHFTHHDVESGVVADVLEVDGAVEFVARRDVRVGPDRYHVGVVGGTHDLDLGVMVVARIDITLQRLDSHRGRQLGAHWHERNLHYRRKITFVGGRK